MNKFNIELDEKEIRMLLFELETLIIKELELTDYKEDAEDIMLSYAFVLDIIKRFYSILNENEGYNEFINDCNKIINDKH